ncbi:hypothetical protein [Riemerella columbipharyngis]|uniref:Uncharacterized protein n=1 Tax=Riemerella columbipharyngis TaxID=1071918 RepID=A0A1G6ZPK9_9FLAO|nr:hypothetical protein [Riemerella columbipharyngis]SDE04479.1 hypothetical protein SAMN05421544_102159 [Riemerella columbipharyngis]
MRKFILFTILMVFLGGVVTSCRKDDDKKSNSTTTEAKIKVVQNGKVKQGVTVYMFDANAGPNTVFFKPIHSDRSVVTEADGVATFKLQDVYDLEVIDKQTTIYFGVFSGNNVLGYTAVTIEKGQIKSAGLKFKPTGFLVNHIDSEQNDLIK